jgi:CRP-like cAMP-binding protein
LAASRDKLSPVTVEAQTALSVLFFPAGKILGRCRNYCPRHDRLIANFLNGVAEKALHLHYRNDCLIRPSVRGKVLAYLQRESQGLPGEFGIPLDRGGMAKYLHVERSALSRELSRMQREGLLEYRKNRFRLNARLVTDK